jgi:hypothetical protein
MKKLTNIFVIAIMIIGFFTVFNAYAQEGLKIDFQGQQRMQNNLLGVDPDDVNSVTTPTTGFMSGITVAISNTAPFLMEGFEETQGMNDISPIMKKGLIAVVDDGINALNTSTPTIDLYAHLAKEWVPGYDETQSGIYAANQQSGYEELVDSGIVEIWANVRNLSYIVFIIIMLIAGFMIMFRHKIGGQTLITLGNSLPNIILALILVTFSFAIAGLIIDLGGVVMLIVQDILGLNDYVSTHSLWSLMTVFFHGTGRVLTVAGTGSVGLAATIIGVVGILTATAGSNPVGWFVLGGVGLITLLIILFIIGVVLVGSFVVLFTLVKAYIGILLNVILAPIQITIGAIPGNQQMIKSWFNSLFRNVLTFPVVFFLINLPLAMADATNLNLGFPEKLVYIDSVSSANGMDAAAAIFIFIMQIFVYFYAAQVPKFLEAIFPPNTPKAFQEGMAGAKASLSKIPLVGGLFK